MKKYKRLHLKKQSLQNKWVREGDQVIVLTGNDAGKTGKVLTRTATHVVVEGLNLRKKTVKKSEEAPKGRILEMEAPIHASNVSICDEAGSQVSLFVKLEESGAKNLCYLKDNKEVVHRSLGKTAV